MVQPANVKIGNPPYTVWPSNPNATIINNGPDDGVTPRIETRADQTILSIAGTNGINFAERFESISAHSSDMAALPPTITGTELGLDMPNTSLNSFGLNHGLNVINLTGRQWRNIQNLNWDSSRLPKQGTHGDFQFRY